MSRTFYKMIKYYYCGEQGPHCSPRVPFLGFYKVSDNLISSGIPWPFPFSAVIPQNLVHGKECGICNSSQRAHKPRPLLDSTQGYKLRPGVAQKLRTASKQSVPVAGSGVQRSAGNARATHCTLCAWPWAGGISRDLPPHKQAQPWVWPCRLLEIIVLL